MNKKLKALLTCLALTTSLGVIAACDIAGGSSDTGSESVVTSTPTSTAPESTQNEGPTISFVVDGEVKKSIIYTPGATEIRGVPDVPEKAGYTGVWEEYTLDGTDVTVNAVYTAIEYTVTFTADEETIATETYTVEDKDITVPAVPEKAGYTGAWEVYELTTGNITVKAVYTAIEYTVTFTADGNVVATVPYTIEMSTIEEPTIPAKEGYGAKWADYTLDGGNKTVEAVYTLGEYTVTFKADGETVSTQTYTIENKEITVPTAPEKEHYTVAWEAYELTTGDITVNAVYTAIEYTVTFKADGVQVGDVQKYTVENKEITAPAVPEKKGYKDGAWEAYELTSGDITVNATYTAIEYNVTFMCDGAVIGTTTYTIENMQIDTAQIPEKAGYTGKLADYDLSKLEDMTIEVVYTANTYKIMYNAGAGECDIYEQDVVYNTEFTLPTAKPVNNYMSFLGWADAQGNMVTAGTWTIADDVVLTAVYTEVLDFEEATEAPSYMTGSRVQSFSIIEEENGNKAVKVQSAADSASDIGVHIRIDFLDEFFADPSVDYFAFDIKLDATATTLMHQIYFQDYRSGSSAWKNYESTACNADFNYIPTATYKTIYLPRAAYQSYIDNGQTTPRFVLVGSGLYGGQSFYLDNFRSVTADEKLQDWWSFEYGGLRTNNGNSPLFYTPDNSQWELNFSNINPTTIQFSHEKVTHGNRSLKFTKLAGVTKISLNHTTDTEGEKQLRAAGAMSFDLYVPEGSNASMYDNATGIFEPLKQGWNTIYTKVPAKGEEKENELVQFWDSTGSTYYIDNIRVLDKSVYEANMLGFEGNTVVVRDQTAGAEESVAYLYGRRDSLAARWTMVIQADKNEVLNKGNRISNFHYDTEIVKEGKQSLAFHKTNGYIYFALNTGGEMYKLLKNGFTFWIYVDLDEQPMINVQGTNNFVSGTNAKFASFNENIKPGTWTKVTVNANEINETGRFLIITGTTAGTYYIDGIEPLPADAE